MNTLCTETRCSALAKTHHRSNGAETGKYTHNVRVKSAAALIKIAIAIKLYFVMRLNRRLDRQAFKNVLSLDDRTLKDIGVTRQDVKWASRLPLSEDAAARLEEIARR